MNLPAIICDAGAEAILKGRKIWGAKNDNEIREEFLSALMAVNLHEMLEKPVRTERNYALLCKELGLEVTAEDINKVADYRADIVIYDNAGITTKPTALVEIKKFNETTPFSEIVVDLYKGKAVRLEKHLKIYLGAFVCETAVDLEQRQAALEKAVGHKVVFSKPYWAISNRWRWCFACVGAPLPVAK